jgi:hypothetical protein
MRLYYSAHQKQLGKIAIADWNLGNGQGHKTPSASPMRKDNCSEMPGIILYGAVFQNGCGFTSPSFHRGFSF